jgi:hypothetical protein
MRVVREQFCTLVRAFRACLFYKLLIYKGFVFYGTTHALYIGQQQQKASRRNISTLTKQKQQAREEANRFFWKGCAIPHPVAGAT